GRSVAGGRCAWRGCAWPDRQRNDRTRRRGPPAGDPVPDVEQSVRSVRRRRARITRVARKNHWAQPAVRWFHAPALAARRRCFDGHKDSGNGQTIAAAPRPKCELGENRTYERG